MAIYAGAKFAFCAVTGDRVVSVAAFCSSVVAAAEEVFAAFGSSVM